MDDHNRPHRLYLMKVRGFVKIDVCQWNRLPRAARKMFAARMTPRWGRKKELLW